MVGVIERDLAQGQRILSRIARDLERPEEIESAYAQALVEEAISRAAGRPTPQSRMAAEGLTASGSEIRPAGGSASEVFFGSEFGSDRYIQFQRSHNRDGYWFYPAADDEGVLKAADEAIEDVMQSAIRGF